MKKFFLSLCVLFLSTVSYQAKAQWVVTDPGNFIGNLLNSVNEIVQTSSTVKNTMDTFKEAQAIYKQGKEYYDALKKVHNLVKDARKVQQTMLMVGDISEIYIENFQKMLSDPNFNPEELDAMADGYTKLLKESADLLTDLKVVVTGGNGLSLNDYERLAVIDRVYNDMRQLKSVTKYYTDKNISVSYLRAKSSDEKARIIELYGKPEDRYW